MQPATIMEAENNEEIEVMSVFNASVQTPTGANAAANDSKPPLMAALSMGAMDSPGALGGTTGIDVGLIHGDVWDQIEGNVMTNVLKNRTYKIFLDETGTVVGNLVYRVNGTTNDTRVSVHNQTNMAQRNDEFLHTRSEIHHQPEHRDQKTEDNNISQTISEFYNEHFELNSFKVSSVGVDLSATPFAFEYTAIASAYKNIAAETAMLECELKELKTAIQIVASDVLAVKAKAAVSHLKAIAANLNAGIAGNADSPFG